MKKQNSARAGRKWRFELRLVVYEDKGWWIGHCLELDIAAEGKTPQEAARSAAELCEFQIKTAIEEGDVESVMRPAPSEFWKMYAVAQELPEFSLPPTELVDRVEARELAFA